METDTAVPSEAAPPLEVPCGSEKDQALVEQVLSEPQEPSERRARERHKITMPVVAAPVDATRRSIGAAFTAISRDLSTSGLSILHSREVAAPFLIVEMRFPSGRRVRVVMKVVRCVPEGKFFCVAGPLVERLDESG